MGDLITWFGTDFVSPSRETSDVLLQLIEIGRKGRVRLRFFEGDSCEILALKLRDEIGELPFAQKKECIDNEIERESEKLLTCSKGQI